MGVGLTPLPLKNLYVTKTPTRENQNNSAQGTDAPSAEGPMTRGSESQNMEATQPTYILSTRTNITIGAWNVQTMYQTGKAAQVAAEMRKYNISILGISETRWTGTSRIRLATGEMILYSGHEEEDAPHSQGVALMLSSAAQRALIGWQAHGPRLITASFRTKKRRLNINIIQCYAPTNDSEEEEKEDFYQRLQEVVQSFSARDIIVTMGDMNAKIGRDNTGYEEVMGRHGEGEMNDNGERFANFCAENRQTIGGSVFPHKRIHKVTWISPDHTTENQIDHICICKKFRRTLLDVRVKRGADVASDHQLVVGRLRLKL